VVATAWSLKRIHVVLDLQMNHHHCQNYHEDCHQRSRRVRVLSDETESEALHEDAND